MSVVSRDRILELLDDKRIEIISTDPNYKFNPAGQVTNDGVDLRLGQYGYIINHNAISYIDTLLPTDHTSDYTRVTLPTEGFVLYPNQFLLCYTLEMISISGGEYLGRITGRSLFSRMGLLICCTQTKFAWGNRSVVPLQLVNLSPVPLIIYPRQKLVCFQLELMHGTSAPYDGQFRDEKFLKLPIPNEEEISGYSEAEKSVMFSLHDIHYSSPSDHHDQIVKKAGRGKILAFYVIIQATLAVIMAYIGSLIANLATNTEGIGTVAEKWKSWTIISLWGFLFLVLAANIVLIIFAKKGEKQ